MTDNNQAEVALPASKEPDLSTLLVQALLQQAQKQNAEYRVLIGHTGAYLSGSMTAAHARGYNDAIKVILKEIENVQKNKQAPSAPRQLDAITVEFQEAAAKLATASYQSYVLAKEIERLHGVMEQASLEASARKDLDAQVAKAGADNV